MTEPERWAVYWARVDQHGNVGPAIVDAEVDTHTEALCRVDVLRSNLREAGHAAPLVETRPVRELTRSKPPGWTSWDKSVPTDFLSKLCDRSDED